MMRATPKDNEKKKPTDYTDYTDFFNLLNRGRCMLMCECFYV